MPWLCMKHYQRNTRFWCYCYFKDKNVFWKWGKKMNRMDCIWVLPLCKCSEMCNFSLEEFFFSVTLSYCVYDRTQIKYKCTKCIFEYCTIHKLGSDVLSFVSCKSGYFCQASVVLLCIWKMAFIRYVICVPVNKFECVTTECNQWQSNC